MTTVRQLFAEEIFLKGEPITGGGGGGGDITNVENNVTTINAVISGLTGGRPIAASSNSKSNSPRRYE